ncbi:hypothetical protein FOVG_19680 [Fusarium oxysporum f. sp. pisi HDV247]|uniref:Uncharacterized protein n=1 Tax=Fusarium oxysporum f. sp. pisi HDV247 TaxID=1080344 RepID=W9NDD8_FUSOX|nr:hypothetical protein FOVG_19680 [Fusarium oxysporum f. sp. pisi HDV247]
MTISGAWPGRSERQWGINPGPNWIIPWDDAEPGHCHAIPNGINEVRVEVAETLGREDDTELAKVAWLSRRDDLKMYGSMVVYFKKRSEAKEFIGEGLSWLEESSTPQECLNAATA